MNLSLGMIALSLLLLASTAWATNGASEMVLRYDHDARTFTYATPGPNPDAVITEAIQKKPGKWNHTIKITQDDSPTSSFKITQLRDALKEKGEKTDRYEYRFKQMKYDGELGHQLYDFSYVVKYTGAIDVEDETYAVKEKDTGGKKITQRFKVDGKTKILYKYVPSLDETRIYRDKEDDGTHDLVLYTTVPGFKSIKLTTFNGFVLPSIDLSN